MHAFTRRLGAAVAGGALCLSLVSAIPPSARAAGVIVVNTTSQTINTDGSCSLEEAIYSANLDNNVAPDPSDLRDGGMFATGCLPGSGDDTIVLPAGATFVLSAPVEGRANYLGPTGTPYVTSTIDIEGQGATIRHASNNIPFRAFSVAAGGDLTLHEVDVNGFRAKGGNGAGGGGGGLGAGGAIYVHAGRLGIGWSTFEGNSATGGNAGSGNVYGAGGGGGGLGGNGGHGSNTPLFPYDTGGGGGGARGDGASLTDDFPEAGGGGGTINDGGTDGTGGFDCGGNGGVAGTFTDGDGENVDTDCPGGGGGGGDEGGGSAAPFASGGEGGSGSYGGGGGGGGYPDGDGGHGGFGGGGGAGPSFSSTDGNYGGGGGNGGFGAGGGAGPGGLILGDPGDGGTFAGDATDEYGGAGAALGGAVFGDSAFIEIQNSTFAGNSVLHGSTSGPDKTRAQDAGGAVFAVDGWLSVSNTTISGNDSTGDGAGLVMYRSTRFASSAQLRLRNSIIGGNGGHDECFVLGGVTNWQSANNLVTGHGTDDVRTPCFNINLADDPALGPLQLNAPGRTRTMALLAGSPAIGGADPASATPDDQRGVLRDASPDLGAFEFSGQPPVTTIDLSPAAPDGSNGWYVSPVGLTIGATDADSTVAQTRCALDPSSVPASFADLPDAACAPTSVSADGEHDVYAASADTEGNVEIPVASATFKIDQTNPTLSPSLSSTTIQLGQTGVTASPNADDATSGVASASCDPVDTSTPGVHTVNCSATDNAGNTASASIDYVVAYEILGFFSPVPGSKWQAGSAVPVKVALANAAGVRISDANAQALANACAVTFSVAGVQPKQAQCFKYDPLTDQFVFIWHIGKRPLGNVTITVSISYTGTMTTTTLSEQVTIVRL